MTSKTAQDTKIQAPASWLEPHRKAFMKRIAAQGYSAPSTRGYEHASAWACRELEPRANRNPPLDGKTIAELKQAALNRSSEPPCGGTSLIYRVGRFIDFLVEAGAACLPEPPVKEPSARESLRAEYGSYLLRQRAMSESTIHHRLGFFDRFMTFRFGSGLGDLNALTPEDVVSFLRMIMTGRRPHRGKTPPSHLRSLFHFLFWSGRTGRNLAGAIPRVSHPAPSNLPRHLKPEEILRLIDSARLHRSAGRRNRAMLLLQARLGLRAPEVVAIRLEDIDWRAGEILIRGKGGLHDRMPLPEEAGEAVVDYIQNERAGTSRALFVSARAPHSAFKDAQIINDVLKKALEKARITPPPKHVGSHLLRHSLAMSLLGGGASLEEISHVLRHRSRATTAVYARCDIQALRPVAQAWPMEGGAL
jgi:integrase/recombinase XerD